MSPPHTAVQKARSSILFTDISLVILDPEEVNKIHDLYHAFEDASLDRQTQ